MSYKKNADKKTNVTLILLMQYCYKCLGRSVDQNKNTITVRIKWDLICNSNFLFKYQQEGDKCTQHPGSLSLVI